VPIPEGYASYYDHLSDDEKRTYQRRAAQMILELAGNRAQRAESSASSDTNSSTTLSPEGSPRRTTQLQRTPQVERTVSPDIRPTANEEVTAEDTPRQIPPTTTTERPSSLRQTAVNTFLQEMEPRPLRTNDALGEGTLDLMGLVNMFRDGSIISYLKRFMKPDGGRRDMAVPTTVRNRQTIFVYWKGTLQAPGPDDEYGDADFLVQFRRPDGNALLSIDNAVRKIAVSVNEKKEELYEAELADTQYCDVNADGSFGPFNQQRWNYRWRRGKRHNREAFNSSEQYTSVIADEQIKKQLYAKYVQDKLKEWLDED
jgi:hypothetical protein